MERDWSLKGNDAVSGRTAPATTPASPGGGTGGSWRIWNIFASSQPGWPIRPGASIFYGVRGEKSRSLEHICRFPAESTAGKLGELEHIRCSPAKSPPEHGKLPVFAVRFWNVKKLCSKSVVFYFQEYKNHLFLGG